MYPKHEPEEEEEEKEEERKVERRIVAVCFSLLKKIFRRKPVATELWMFLKLLKSKDGYKCK